MSYWKMCVEEAVSELGISCNEEQLRGLIERVESGHDYYGMAHGHECIPNPAEVAREEDSRRHKRELAQAEERERLLKKNISDRYNADVWVSVRDGEVAVERVR